MSISIEERYNNFVNGESDFGTEYDWSSLFVASLETSVNRICCFLKLFESIRATIRRKRSNQFNSFATSVLFDICRGQYASPERIVKLLCLGADPDFVNSDNSRSCLHYLVENGTPRSAEVFLLCTGRAAHCPDLNGMTPLILACGLKSSWRQCSVVKVLLSHLECNIDYVNNDGLCALAVALTNRNIKVLQMLLLAGATVLSLSSDFLSSLLEEDCKIGSYVENDSETEEEKEDGSHQELFLEDFNSESEKKSNRNHDTESNKISTDENTVKHPSLLHSRELACSVHKSNSNGTMLEQLITDNSLNYRLSYVAMVLVRRSQSITISQLCQRLVNYRLIEEERSLKKCTITPENKTARHIISNQAPYNTVSNDEQTIPALERNALRFKRKRAKLRSRVPLETVKQKRELEMWDVIRARILSRIDKEYNTNASLKGLFK